MDAGDNAFVPEGATDVDGQPRIQGARVDIGADEADGLTRSITRQIIRVTPGGNDANDGAAWATAKAHLSAAVAALAEGGEVWVSGEVLGSAAIPPFVSLYGGFGGDETERDQRDPAAYPSTVAGRLDITAGRTGVVVDGLTIHGDAGKAVRITGGTPLVSHCVLPTEGVQCREGAPVIANCAITTDEVAVEALASGVEVRDSVLRGVGIASVGVSMDDRTSARVVRSSLSGFGTALSIQSYFATPAVMDNRITGNVYGIVSEATSTAFLVSYPIANNVFTQNTAAVICRRTAPRLTNNTMFANGTAVSMDNAAATVENSVISRNGRGILITQPSSSLPPVVRTSCIYGSTYGNYVGMPNATGANGNISADPRLTADGHPLEGSPVIDAGDTAAVALDGRDLDGLPRVRGAAVDMGAFEFQTALSPLDRVTVSLRAAAGLSVLSPYDRDLLDADTSGAVTLEDAATWAERLEP